MNQDVTFSNNVAQFLYENLPSPISNTAQKCLDYLLQNNFVVDKKRNKFKNFIKILDATFDENNPYQRELKNILQKQYEENYSSIDFKYDGEIDDIELSRLSVDRILLKTGMATTELERIRLSENFNTKSVEIHNELTFIKPDHNHRLKHIPTIIVCHYNEIYNLPEILNPFLKNAKYIQFEDPYIRNITALKNFDNILQSISCLNISIKTLKEEKIDLGSSRIDIERYKRILSDYSISENFYEIQNIKKGIS